MFARSLTRPCLRGAVGSSLSGRQTVISRGFGTTDEGSVEIAADYKGFLETIASSPKAVVYYTATWCPPCRAIKPVYAELSTKHPTVKFIKVDVDQNEEAAARASIRSVPAFHFYKSGQVINKFAGADAKLLASTIEELEDKP